MKIQNHQLHVPKHPTNPTPTIYFIIGHLLYHLIGDSKLLVAVKQQMHKENKAQRLFSCNSSYSTECRMSSPGTVVYNKHIFYIVNELDLCLGSPLV